jgi:hypothetical protein
VKRFADDWTSATVELHINVFTRNYVNSAFGGSMRARGGAKLLEWFETEITDTAGDVVARVRREVYMLGKMRVTAAGTPLDTPTA